MITVKKELKKVLKELFGSRTVPWDRVKTVKTDWKRVDVGGDAFDVMHNDNLVYLRNYTVVPVVEITMKDPV